VTVSSSKAVRITRDNLLLPTPYELPDGALELLIADVFAQVLNLDKVGTNDDFFDLGGDSLLAEVISITISERTGYPFQLSALLEYGSPRKVAALIEGRSSTALASTCATREVARPPIFFVHGREGFTLLKPTFRKALADDQKLVMFELPGIRGGRCYERIEDIASIYVEQLLGEQPSGPILLAAFCMGSVIALEMAAQLAKIGRPVHKLALIDPSLPFSKRWLRVSLEPRLALSKALVRYLPHALPYVPNFLHELRFRRSLNRERREGRDMYASLRLSVRAQAKLRVAYLNYTPQTFHGAVAILLSSRGRATAAWAGLSPERGTRVKTRVDELLPQRHLHVFEGTHEGISASPAVAHLLQTVFCAAPTNGSALIDPIPAQ
jgi:thioesterase domain-containing protein/acyl carrier protein